MFTMFTFFFFSIKKIKKTIIRLEDTSKQMLLITVKKWSPFLHLYDTISDIMSIRDILLGFIWYYIGHNKYSRCSIGIIWYYIGHNKYSRYSIGIIWYYIGHNKYSRCSIGIIWYYIGHNKYPRYPIEIYMILYRTQ